MGGREHARPSYSGLSRRARRRYSQHSARTLLLAAAWQQQSRQREEQHSRLRAARALRSAECERRRVALLAHGHAAARGGGAPCA